MVEHAAPGREHFSPGRARDLERVPLAPVRDDGRLHASVPHAAHHPYTDRDPEPAQPLAPESRNMTHFLAMGGYAAYVWPAYGVSAFGIGAAVFLTLRAYRRARKLLATAQARASEP